MNEEKCICCGAIVPEGRQICPQCESNVRAASTELANLHKADDVEKALSHALALIANVLNDKELPERVMSGVGGGRKKCT